MSHVYVLCRGNACSHRFPVQLKATDQVLVCPLCGEYSTFVNLGVFQCRSCSHLQKVSLALRPHTSRCERCGQESPAFGLGGPNSQLKYWPLEHHEQLEGNYLIQGCRLAAFSQSENEVEIAKEALERAHRSGWSAFRQVGPPRHAMFIRSSGLAMIPGDREIPVQIRTYHAYCNFPWYPGDAHNAKFSGSLAGFATGWPFRVAFDENDCEEVWLGDRDLLAELGRFPSLAKYRPLFKVI